MLLITAHQVRHVILKFSVQQQRETRRIPCSHRHKLTILYAANVHQAGYGTCHYDQEILATTISWCLKWATQRTTLPLCSLEKISDWDKSVVIIFGLGALFLSFVLLSSQRVASHSCETLRELDKRTFSFSIGSLNLSYWLSHLSLPYKKRYKWKMNMANFSSPSERSVGKILMKKIIKTADKFVELCRGNTENKR